jgi:hypothetical protein
MRDYGDNGYANRQNLITFNILFLSFKNKYMLCERLSFKMLNADISPF